MIRALTLALLFSLAAACVSAAPPDLDAIRLLSRVRLLPQSSMSNPPIVFYNQGSALGVSFSFNCSTGISCSFVSGQMTITATGGGGGGTCTPPGVQFSILYDTVTGCGDLASLGTTTTVLHGNAAGLPTFGAVVSADLNITGTTCTNQFLTVISSAAAGTCTTDTLASAQHANQGTTTTVLHGNGSGNPSFAAVSLANDVTGQLPIAAVGSSGLSGTSPIAISSAGAISCSTCNTSSATVSSIATTSPITGGTITTTGTIACGTCATTTNGGALSGTAPVAVSAAGAISITGGAGQVLAGSAPAFTATPALGTDNSVAGTLQLANGAANAHTIWSSGATTTNTIAGFTAVPTNGHLVSCTVSATTCTLTDGGAAGTGTVTSIATTSPLGGGTITTTGTLTCSTCVTSAASLTSNAIVLGAGSQGSKTVAAIVTDGTSIITLGTDNSVAGSVQLANGSSNAHTIFSSGATTTNTIAGFTAAPTTLDLIECTTASTTCTLTDAGILTANVVTAASNGTTKQLCTVASSNNACTWIDFPDVKEIPAANCNNATGGNGWSIGSGGTVSCRAGTNNLGGFVQISDTSSTFATFQIDVPEDWDTGVMPYIRVKLSSSDATNGHTVIPSESVACYVGDGSGTDDIAQNATRSLSTVTLNGNANRFWSTSNLQLNSTDMTNCVGGSTMQVTIGRATDTATAASVRFYSATITFPRLLTVQAN